MTKLGRFLRLPREERLLALRAGVALAVVRVLLALLPHTRVREITSGDGRGAWGGEEDGAAHGVAAPAPGGGAGGARPGTPRGETTRAGPTPREIGRAVERAATVVPGATCLVQALAAEWLLRREGWDPTVRIGVARHGNGVAAHAWVECGGEIVLGGEEAAAYAALAHPSTEFGAVLCRLGRFPVTPATSEALGRALVCVAAGDGRADWEGVLAGVRRHGLVPLAHLHLTALGPGVVPDDLLARLRKEAEEEAHSALHLTARLLEALRVLEQAGVQAIPFKGPALERRLYGEAGVRSFGDLDLLVRPADAKAAVVALAGAGYRADADAAGGWEEALVRDAVLTLVREGDAPVELHQRMVHPVHRGRFDFDGVWARAGSLRIGGATILDLHRDDLLLLLCLHGAKHGWDRLGWVADLARLLEVEAEWDWPAVLRRARKEGLGRIVVCGLHLAGELLGAPVPAEVRAEAARDAEVRALVRLVRARLAGPVPPGSYYLRFHWRVAEGWRGRLAMVRRTLFTLSPADRVAVRVPAGLGWVRYAVRPMRLAWRYLRPGEGA